jgi:hypothetical protein
VYRLFGLTREILKAPGGRHAREFAKIAVVVLNQKVRPFTARWHRLALAGMAIKKSDLYSSLWASCDELRGGMDASQYKDYVLFMLFIKYISDKYADSTTSRRRWSSRPGASFGHGRAQGQAATSATRSTPRSSSR